ncbi:MAG: arginine--tRNA ligase [Candidatus Pacearchaeota archaeon]|nr:arginine--tRNA ligase [Candidatus Pacearchaeota archaeon]
MKDKIINSLKVTGLSHAEIEKLIEIPKDIKLGDYAFPCFSLAKKLKKSPIEIAKDLASSILKNISKAGKDLWIEKVDALNGYVNFFINQKKLALNILSKIEKEKEEYGKSKTKRKTMIEFSDPNTHKAFHIGHVRGTSFGESLARILEFSGDNVIRANYSGDTGMHVAKWIWCYQKYHFAEELNDNESWIAGIYVDAVKRLSKNESFQEEVNKINRKLSNKKDKQINKLWKKTKELSIKSWERIYHELNTKFDVYFFESEVEERGKEIVSELIKKKIAEISDEAVIARLDNYGLGVWVLLRKDKTILYSAKDLALAEKKFKDFKINYSIVETGSEQDLHFRQLIKTLELMNFKHFRDYKHLSHGLVKLPWGKMSSRTGDNVLYSDFRDKMIKITSKEIEKRFPKLESTRISERALAIFISALKYGILKQDLNKNIVFNPEKSISFEGDTGPYLLYSYARALRILEKAEYKKQKKFSVSNVSEEEKKLIGLLASFPNIVKNSYENLAPNLIANYSYDLAKSFSEFYHSCIVIGAEKEQFRLKIVDSFSQVMKSALFLLGISVIPEM